MISVVAVGTVVVVDDARADDDVLEDLRDVADAGDEHLVVAEGVEHVPRVGEHQHVVPQQPERMAAKGVVRHVSHAGRLVRGRDVLGQPCRRLDLRRLPLVDAHRVLPERRARAPHGRRLDVEQVRHVAADARNHERDHRALKLAAQRGGQRVGEPRPDVGRHVERLVEDQVLLEERRLQRHGLGGHHRRRGSTGRVRDRLWERRRLDELEDEVLLP